MTLEQTQDLVKALKIVADEVLTLHEAANPGKTPSVALTTAALRHVGLRLGGGRRGRGHGHRRREVRDGLERLPDPAAPLG